MYKISKEDFCELLAIRPRSVIGKEITLEYDGHNENVKFTKIIDVNLGGNYIFVEVQGNNRWIKADKLCRMIIMDSPPDEKAETISMMSKEFKILSNLKEVMTKCCSDKEESS